MVIDAKTGKPSPAHSAQVMVYQYTVPRALEQYRGLEFPGHVSYPDGNVQILASGVDAKFVDRLGALIRVLADEASARRVPSTGECRWCDITVEDCSERMEWEGSKEGAMDDF